MAVITQKRAAQHLRIDEVDLLDDEVAQDLDAMREYATVLTLRYLGHEEDAFQVHDSSTGELLPHEVPRHVEIVALVWLGCLYTDRGNQDPEKAEPGAVPDKVRQVAVQWRKVPISSRSRRAGVCR